MFCYFFGFFIETHISIPEPAIPWPRDFSLLENLVYHCRVVHLSSHQNFILISLIVPRTLSTQIAAYLPLHPFYRIPISFKNISLLLISFQFLTAQLYSQGMIYINYYLYILISRNIFSISLLLCIRFL